MARRRAGRALISIVAVVATTMLLAACNRAESTPATFDFQPVATLAGSTASTAAPRATTTTTAPSATTTVPATTTTTESPTTTGTFRVVSNAAPATSSATTVTTTTTTVAPTTTTVAAPTTTVGASQGWITVLASLSTANYTRAEAAAWRVELGISDAELLLSNDYSSLTPGYWVLYRGPFGDRASAAGVCGSYGNVVPGCYPAPLNLAG